MQKCRQQMFSFDNYFIIQYSLFEILHSLAFAREAGAFLVVVENELARFLF